MDTGWDIMFFWVARMILATTYATGEVPFKTVYLHGLVRTEAGHKMSKSNPDTIVDPMEVIPEYGTDSLRLALLQGMSAGNDQRLGKSKIIANRNFANKLWNIARYIEDVVGDETGRAGARPQTVADHWVLNKLQRYQKDISSDVEHFRFNLAYERLYHFVWDDLADWYIEASKAEPNRPLLAYILEQVLLLAHPFAPFVTETIWQTLAWEQGSILASRTWEPLLGFDKKLAAQFEELQAIVSEVRYIKRALKVTGVTLYHDNVAMLEASTATIKQLAGLKAVAAGQGSGLHLTSTKYPCWLDIDPAKAQAYAKELKTKQSRQESLIKQLKARLANNSYTKNAPAAVVDQTRHQLTEAKAQLDSLQAEIRRFQS